MPLSYLDIAPPGYWNLEMGFNRQVYDISTYRCVAWKPGKQSDNLNDWETYIALPSKFEVEMFPERVDLRDAPVAKVEITFWRMVNGCKWELEKHRTVKLRLQLDENLPVWWCRSFSVKPSSSFELEGHVDGAIKLTRGGLAKVVESLLTEMEYHEIGSIPPAEVCFE